MHVSCMTHFLPQMFVFSWLLKYLCFVGRVIDWSINFLKTASGASSTYDVDYTSTIQDEQETGDEDEVLILYHSV